MSIWYVMAIRRGDGRGASSGKKYKKTRSAASKRLSRPLPPGAPPPPPLWMIEDDRLDDLSNSVVDLVHERLVECLHAERGIERVRQAPRQHAAREPVHD